jgi:glycosyltransferase involved in cell wall biosynthesis
VPDKIPVIRINLNFSSTKNRPSINFVQWLLFNLFGSLEIVHQYAKGCRIVEYQSIYSSIPALFAKLFLRMKTIGDDFVLFHPLADGIIIRLTDVISTPSAKTYSLAKSLKKVVFYVPNGIKKTENKRALKNNLPVFLFVGALSFGQNVSAVEKIIQIADGLDKDGLDFQINIVGGPIYKVSHLTEHSVVKKGKVTFLGHVSNEKLSQLFSSSVFGILPFFSDTPLLGGQRTKALEYFENNLIVISGLEGVAGISGIKPEKHYLLAKSAEDMQSIMADCIRSPEKYYYLATDGPNFVKENYSWDTIAKNYIEYISSG